MFVKSLHGNVGDPGEFTDDRFYLLKFYPEASYLDLGVFTTYEFDVTVRPVPDDIACAVNAFVQFIVFVAVGDKHLGGLVGTVQIPHTDLLSGHEKLSRGSRRHPLARFGYHIGMDSVHRASDGNIGLLLDNLLVDDVAYAFGRAIAVEELVFGQRNARHLFAACI